MHEHSLEFERALLAVDRPAARRVLELALSSPNANLESVVVPALERIGQAWQAGTVALSQVYMAGRIAEEVLSTQPQARPARPAAGRVAIAVLEDHHFLGKRMVLAMLTAAGVPVTDLGHVTVEELVEQVCVGAYDVLLVSVLMLPSALRVKVLMERLAERGRRVPVIVGGAPFRLDPTLAARVGASAWGASAADAVHLVARFQEARS